MTDPFSPTTECLGEETLALYLDGIKGEARDAIETHLAACDGCRERLAALYRDLQWLLSEEEAPGAVAFHTETRDFAQAKENIEDAEKAVKEPSEKMRGTGSEDTSLPLPKLSGGREC